MKKLATCIGRRSTAVIALAIAATGCVAEGAAGISAPLPAAVPANGRYIVVLEPSARPRDVAAAAGVRPDFVYSHALNGFAASLPPQAIAALARSPRVLRIDADQEVHASAQTLPTGVDRIDAEQNGIARIDGVDDRVAVDVAVLDTGIDLDHPDLNASPARAVDCLGGSVWRPRCEAGGDDDNGHGTHVAGTVGAIDDGEGVVGVAPGARLWAVKVLDASGSGWWSQIIAGVDWVTARADVIAVANMSLGGAGSDLGGCGGSALHLAICNSVAAGVVYVVSAGNSGADAAGAVPAAYDEVITVSALADFDGAPGGDGAPTCRADQDDTLAGFSNYGPDVDLMAPGVCIRSTRMGGGTTVLSGTSMSSPHVAGAAALYVAAHGRDLDRDGDHDGDDVAAIRDALLAAGDPSPCASTDGACPDDPDRSQEPLVYAGEGCAIDAECADGHECTVDSCAGGLCAHAERADGAACAGGICCSGACVDVACSADADCDDGRSCTSDVCVDAGACGARCVSTWPACGAADGCCGPSCAADPDCASATCGDGVCAGGGEDCGSCRADCRCAGRGCSKACCGDGVCQRSENESNCASDCA